MKKNVSQAQLNANRVNARKSTGPRSASGKRTASLNGQIHGFAGQTCFVPAHEQEAYQRHFQRFRAEHNPKGISEEYLVQSLADLAWSTSQIRAVANNLISLLGTQPTPFEANDDAETFNLAQAANVGKHIQQLNLLGIYENRKTRLFNSVLKELLALQESRKARELAELTAASEIRRALKTAYNPADDGFACSLQEVDRFIASQNRRYQARGLMTMAS